MAKILMSIGPIPAKLDSVKFITNRFKGGLAHKTAMSLMDDYGHDVTIIKHKSIVPVRSRMNIIDVEDVNDYIEKILDFKADIYVLAGAVANLMPSNPWEGKFPSHNYKVGEKFNIEFEIAPRVIDMIKKKYPTSGLIGYKLFDGTDKELKDAGWETLINSKSNIVFANHPKWAKERKIMMTLDGAEIECSFDDHIKEIDKLANAKFYKTEILDDKDVDRILGLEVLKILSDKYPKYLKRGFTFGCFALKLKNGRFITTTRGKNKSGFSIVNDIDHDQRIIFANNKATLNAPLLHKLFELNPEINILIHGHKQIKDISTKLYAFPGTVEEVNLVEKFYDGCIAFAFNIINHGYIAGFKNINDCLKWLDKNG